MAQLDNIVALVTGASRGAGRGVALRCDHTVAADVESLFDRIRGDHGRLDMLVNNVWAGYENSACRPLPLVAFWKQSLHQWDGMFTAGVRAHLTASRLAVPLMLAQGRGLIASTTANLEALPKSGQLVEVGTLAREYGLTDIDGTQPPPFRIPASKQ